MKGKETNSIRVTGKKMFAFCTTVTSFFILYFLWLLSFSILVAKHHAFCFCFAFQDCIVLCEYSTQRFLCFFFFFFQLRDYLKG